MLGSKVIMIIENNGRIHENHVEILDYLGPYH